MKPKTIMLHILSLLVFAAAPAAGAVTVAQADSAYSQERYQEALKLYGQCLKEQGSSSGLYYNMGCAHYRMHDYTHAIISFERALVLDPSNADARANLRFVRDKAGISEDTGSTFFSNALSGFVGRFSSNTWAAVAVMAFLLMLGAAALYVFAGNVLLRKTGFFGGIVLLVASASAMLCALHMHAVQSGHAQAIVTVPVATLSEAPHTPAPKEVAFTLKQGYKVHITDSVRTTSSGSHRQVWLNVKSGDGRQAWINAKDVEKI